MKPVPAQTVGNGFAEVTGVPSDPGKPQVYEDIATTVSASEEFDSGQNLGLFNSMLTADNTSCRNNQESPKAWGQDMYPDTLGDISYSL